MGKKEHNQKITRNILASKKAVCPFYHHYDGDVKIYCEGSAKWGRKTSRETVMAFRTPKEAWDWIERACGQAGYGRICPLAIGLHAWYRGETDDGGGEGGLRP